MSERILSPSTYYLVFGTLIGLTFLTLGASFLHLPGFWHLVVGLVIGLCKALLVVLFFMHVLYSSRLTWVVLGAGLFWLAIMLVYTLNDYVTRGIFPYPGH